MPASTRKAPHSGIGLAGVEAAAESAAAAAEALAWLGEGHAWLAAPNTLKNRNYDDAAQAEEEEEEAGREFDVVDVACLKSH